MKPRSTGSWTSAFFDLISSNHFVLSSRAMLFFYNKSTKKECKVCVCGWGKNVKCVFILCWLHIGLILWMSVQFICSVLSYSLGPHGLQHARLLCLSPTPGACSNSCPSSRWCHPTISSSVVPFSHLQSFIASGSFPVSQFLPSGGQTIGASASASVLPMNIQDWFPSGLTDLISLHSKDSQESSPTPQFRSNFFGAQLSLWSSCHIHTWLSERT